MSEQQSAAQQPWPQGVTHRYENQVGATVDIRKNGDGYATARCTGCPYTHNGNTGNEAVHREAQAHAEKCRAQQRPAVNA